MLGITEYKYLTRDHLEGFDNYKYMAIDTSPLSNYVMHPFWNNVVKLVPRWVAPNVLTFAGFLLTVLDFLLLSYFDYDYLAASAASKPSPEANGVGERIPQGLWYFLAVFLFLAYTLDGIDGKQARRTQTSGPLGELFDHGLDSYSVFFIPACLYSVFGKEDFSIPPIRMYYILWNILFNFYISHWEKYNTGVLFLPWGYDFSMWASTLVFLWTGLNGTGYYKKYMFGSYTLANVFEWVIYATGVMTNLPVSVYNVYKSYKTGTGKKRSITGALRPLWALLLVFGISSYWVHHSTILTRDCRVVFLLMGTLFSNVACRLIVAQMSNQPCPAGNGLVVPLLLAAMTSLSSLAKYDVTALYVLTAFVVCAHVHYGSSVVRQMCDHFRIKCFTIKQRTD